MSKRKTTLLVVDDEKRLWEPYGSHFEHQGYAVKFAENGHVAVTTVTQGDVDAVVMDLHMPFVDGQLGIKVLKEIRPELPIIIVSGFVTPEQVENGIEGAFRVLM